MVNLINQRSSAKPEPMDRSTAGTRVKEIQERLKIGFVGHSAAQRIRFLRRGVIGSGTDVPRQRRSNHFFPILSALLQEAALTNPLPRWSYHVSPAVSCLRTRSGVSDGMNLCARLGGLPGMYQVTAVCRKRHVPAQCTFSCLQLGSEFGYQ